MTMSKSTPRMRAAVPPATRAAPVDPADDELAAAIRAAGLDLAPPFPEYLAVREGWLVCSLCQKYATLEHLASRRHAARAEYVPQLHLLEEGWPAA